LVTRIALHRDKLFANNELDAIQNAPLAIEKAKLG